jgi:hypothetical protein
MIFITTCFKVKFLSRETALKSTQFNLFPKLLFYNNFGTKSVNKVPKIKFTWIKTKNILKANDTAF